MNSNEPQSQSADIILGIILIVSSLVAVVGNVLAIYGIYALCKKSKPTFTTILYLNTALCDLVRGCSNWIVTGPVLLTGRRVIPPSYMTEQVADSLCQYFLVTAEKVLPAMVLYTITYLAAMKILLYFNPLRHSDIHYLLHYKTTVVLLIHIWAILVPVCLFPVLLSGSKFMMPVCKCAYNNITIDHRLIIWWSVYNSLFLTLPLLVLIVLSIILIARIVKLAREHRMNFSGCHSTGKQLQYRSRQELVRTLLFTLTSVCCFSVEIYVACRDTFDLIRKGKDGYNSSVTRDSPYCVLTGMLVLLTVNAAINPWIYLVNNKSILKAWRKQITVTEMILAQHRGCPENMKKTERSKQRRYGQIMLSPVEIQMISMPARRKGRVATGSYSGGTGSKSPTIKVTFDHDNIEIGINIKNTVAEDSSETVQSKSPYCENSQDRRETTTTACSMSPYNTRRREKREQSEESSDAQYF